MSAQGPTRASATTPERVVWIADPHMPWTTPPAYAVLNERLIRLGTSHLGPWSTAAEVNDSFFDLMGGDGPSTAERNAWSALRTSLHRLAVDFFHYRLPAFDPAETDTDLLAYEFPEIGLADIARLAAVPVNIAAVWQCPSQISPNELYALAGHQPEPATQARSTSLDTLPSSLPSLEAILWKAP